MTYLIHVRLERINAQNIWTACKRVVSPSMARTDRSLSDCTQCLKNTKPCLSFDQTRDKSLLKRRVRITLVP